MALVLAAHGDRGGSDPNRTLRDHAESLKQSGRFRFVTWGVLKGEREIEVALEDADRAGPTQITVFPMFMSGGYFVNQVLSQRIKEAEINTPIVMLPPLGLHPDLPPLMFRRALDTAREAGFDPADTGLLVVGHGSKYGSASADATRHVAEAIRRLGGFARVDVAFLEEPPFLRSELLSPQPTRVVVGFFFGSGMHGADDVLMAIEETGARAIYARPIGADPEIPSLIISMIDERFSSHKET